MHIFIRFDFIFQKIMSNYKYQYLYYCYSKSLNILISYIDLIDCKLYQFKVKSSGVKVAKMCEY